MKERRGWLWLGSGVLLAIIAGMLTFRVVSDLASSAAVVNQTDSPTVPVIVAVVDISPYSLINTGMLTLQNMPTHLVPREYSQDLESVLGKMATSRIATGEVLVNHRLADPTDPNAPLLYTMNVNEVLVTVPADALLSQLNMLAVGNRIDIAYTAEVTIPEEKLLAAGVSTDDKEPGTPTQTAFLSLQNLEVKGLLRRATGEEALAQRPEAILLSVSPQEALILKYLVDTGAPMDIFLRAPANNALLSVVPVDEQYLVDYFQLYADSPITVVRSNRVQMGEEEE
jgi:Flp pilus assembly protein CpaB